MSCDSIRKNDDWEISQTFEKSAEITLLLIALVIHPIAFCCSPYLFEYIYTVHIIVVNNSLRSKNIFL